MRPPCMTVKQTAEHFGVTPPTVYGWINSGELECLRLPGGGIRIRKIDIEKFEERCHVQNTERVDSSRTHDQRITEFFRRERLRG